MESSTITEGRLLRPNPVNRNVNKGRAIKATATAAAKGQYASQAGAAVATFLTVAGRAGAIFTGTIGACGAGWVVKGSNCVSGTTSTSKIDGPDCLLTTSCSPSCSLLMA